MSEEHHDPHVGGKAAPESRRLSSVSELRALSEAASTLRITGVARERDGCEPGIETLLLMLVTAFGFH